MHVRPLAVAIALAVTLPVLMAAKAPPKKQTGQKPQVAPAAPMVEHPGPPGTIIIAGREVLELQPVGYYTGEDRSVEVLRRITRVIEPKNDMLNVNLEPFNASRDIRVSQVSGKPVVQFKGETVATVTSADQQAIGESADEIAQMWANNLKAGLEALHVTSRADNKRVLEQIQAGVGGQTVANGVTGVTETAIADRIRRDIARDPVLKETDLNVDVLSDQVIIRNEATTTEDDVRRLEEVIRREAGDRRINEGNELGTEATPTP